MMSNLPGTRFQNRPFMSIAQGVKALKAYSEATTLHQDYRVEHVLGTVAGMGVLGAALTLLKSHLDLF
jgi:hypothetical protein